jgi:hypothetical protein
MITACGTDRPVAQPAHGWVNADEHVVQPLVAGPESRREVVEPTFDQLTESLHVGK